MTFTAAFHSAIAGYHLDGESANLFAKVYKGHPQSFAPLGGKPIARWHVAGSIDPPEGPRVITGRRMVAAVFTVQCYWPLSSVEGAQTSQEDKIAETLIGLPAAIIALTNQGYTLASKVVGAVTVDGNQPIAREFPFPDGETEGVVLTLTVHARILEAS